MQIFDLKILTDSYLESITEKNVGEIMLYQTEITFNCLLMFVQQQVKNQSCLVGVSILGFHLMHRSNLGDAYISKVCYVIVK